MLATYGSALLIVVASLYVGRAFFALLGRRHTLWLETPVGLAILLTVCSVLTRIHFGDEGSGVIPERSELALIVCGLLLAASIAYLRLTFADLASFLMAAPVIAVVLVATAIPFVASDNLGIPGVGVNNDMAAHLIFADWLQNQVGPSPTGLRIGYPLGPHGLVATVADALGTEALYGFLGLLIALCVIAGLTSLNVLAGLPPVKRTIAASLVAVPYLVASSFGIGGFKEMMTGIFLLAFALTLREVTRTSNRKALIAALGVLGAGMIANYSYPGLLWLGATAAIWAAGELHLARKRGTTERIRAGVRSARPLIAIAAALMLALAISELPRILDFIDHGAAETVVGTDSKLRYTVPPAEAFGVWPSGEWLYGASPLGLEGWPLFAALGVAAFGFASVWWVRRRDLALPAAVAGSALIYLGTFAVAGRYVEAKALQIPASLIMLFILGALLLPWRREEWAGSPEEDQGHAPRAEPVAAAGDAHGGPIGPSWLRIAIAVPFVALAAYSSFLALRDAIIAPTDRFEEIAQFRKLTREKGVLDLTSDRYFDYFMRNADVRSPARNAELKFPGRPGKSQRLPIDFDSPNPRQLNFPDFAVTTSADYQSGAPPNFEVADRTDSYVLWERTGATPFIGVFAEEARPGRVLRCENPKLARLLKRDGKRGVAITWPRPVIAKRLYWETDGDPVEVQEGETRKSATAELAPGETARQTIVLPRGTWDLSFQYSSPIMPLRVLADGLDVTVPPGLEGAVPYRPDQGPYFPVGRVESEGGPVEIEVTAQSLNRVQRLLGVDATAALGNIAATRLEGLAATALRRACGLYVDHYYLRKGDGLRGPLATGGEELDLEPSR